MENRKTDTIEFSVGESKKKMYLPVLKAHLVPKEVLMLLKLNLTVNDIILLPMTFGFVGLILLK